QTSFATAHIRLSMRRIVLFCPSAVWSLSGEKCHPPPLEQGHATRSSGSYHTPLSHLGISGSRPSWIAMENGPEGPLQAGPRRGRQRESRQKSGSQALLDPGLGGGHFAGQMEGQLLEQLVVQCELLRPSSLV